MREKVWWCEYGSFRPWQECPSRPDPAEVLRFFLGKQGIEQAEYAAYLMDILNLQRSSVYNVLKGDGFDSISRCRKLVTALKMHPPLLGIDAKFYPIECHTYWWKACGFSFKADSQGYPVMSEVVLYLRQQRTQRGEDGIAKVWSQEDVKNATGIGKDAIHKMEHGRNPLILESMSRRAVVASALGTLAGENEPTIFRLFDLDPQAYGVPVPTQECFPVIHLPTKYLTAEMLQERQQRLRASFMEYYTGHAQDRVGEVLELASEGQSLLLRASTMAQRVDVLAIQSRSHRFLACIAREQCQTGSVLLHTNQAVELAKQAMTLPNPKCQGDHAHLLTANELFASALFTGAMGYYEQGQDNLAQEAIDYAVHLFPQLRSYHLKTEILAACALLHAQTATDPMDQERVHSYMHRATQTHMMIQFQDNAPDDNFFFCDNSMLYIYKAMILHTLKMKEIKGDRMSDLLEYAQRLVHPEWIRRQILIEYLLAEYHLGEGDLKLATEEAICALEKSRQIRSRLNRNRLEGLYRRLLDTPYKDRPHLAYLGMKLRYWEQRGEVGLV